MKIYMTLTAAALLLAACTDIKKQEKDALNQVIEVHDEAMTKDEQLVKNKILIDSLLKSKALNNADSTMSRLSKKMEVADEAMESWMHQFNPDNTGKTHEQIMQYLNTQKKMVIKVNQQLDTVIKQSNTHLQPFKK